ncbi:MAG TPA: acyl-CoA dehydrogenase [Planctomycetota bacterium]|nr:acyl-CoA dehydrogenase [Planctomycetota bacterium]
MTLLLLAALALVFVSLCYAGRAFWAWVACAALALGWWRATEIWPLAWGITAGLALALALLFGLRPLRRALLARSLLRAMAGALPRMSDTERAALEAGGTWWDAELFGGAPDWRKLLAFQARELTARERRFMEGPLSRLCAMLDDFRVTREGDLPAEVWDFIKAEGFMGMIIPEEHGGLGFSARAQSAVITTLSARCVTAAVTVMVPNSLGPAELLLHYGTDEQKRTWLPRLASGEEVPCFALTEPHAGSDAASMRSRGVVCRGEWQGREVLGMRLDWDKRYITLSPVATVIGLAFKFVDPDHLLGDREELGITCALIPADLPGVEIGERHDPLGVPFMNGPTRGHGVFVPIDAIIGGRAQAGNGWRMLMQSLSAGRGISLPSLSTGACELATRVAGAWGTVREQFGLPIGRFEGIEARLARIAGLTYLVDGARAMTLGAIDTGEKPAVVTAIMKAYSTECMRVVVNDAMDIQGGSGICRGPNNVLAQAYQSIPTGITVEGANILTRSLIVFGQGAIRCHPYVQAEMAAAEARDSAAFDRAFFGHVNLVFRNAARSLVLGLSGGAFASAPLSGPAARYVRDLTRLSAAFALCADFAMATLGGSLKRKENLSGRLADALAWLYLASGALKRFVAEGQPARDLSALRWSLQHALHQVQEALRGLLANLPSRPAAAILRVLVFPLGARIAPPSDGLSSRLAREILDGGELRLALTSHLYVPPPDEPGLGKLEHALHLVLAARGARTKLKDAVRAGQLERADEPALAEAGVRVGVITERERQIVLAAETARAEAIAVDSFAREGIAEAAL